MSNSIAPGSSADVNVRVTALTTNPNVPVTYKTIILKKNLVNGVNTLTQEMISATNTKYIVKYDYVLGEDITVPANCILEFDGGSISCADNSNLILNLNNAYVNSQGVKCYINNPGNKLLKLSEFGFVGGTSTFCTKQLQTLANLGKTIDVDVNAVYLNASITLTNQIRIYSSLGRGNAKFIFQSTDGFTINCNQCFNGEYKEVDIEAYGNCFNFDGQNTAYVYGNKFSDFEAKSNNGHCFYTSKRRLVWNNIFDNITFSATNGAGFVNMATPSTIYMNLKDFGCKTAVFINCEGTILNYNGGFGISVNHDVPVVLYDKNYRGGTSESYYLCVTNSNLEDYNCALIKGDSASVIKLSFNSNYVIQTDENKCGDEYPLFDINNFEYLEFRNNKLSGVVYGTSGIINCGATTIPVVFSDIKLTLKQDNLASAYEINPSKSFNGFASLYASSYNDMYVEKTNTAFYDLLGSNSIYHSFKDIVLTSRQLTVNNYEIGTALNVTWEENTDATIGLFSYNLYTKRYFTKIIIRNGHSSNNLIIGHNRTDIANVYLIWTNTNQDIVLRPNEIAILTPVPDYSQSESSEGSNNRITLAEKLEEHYVSSTPSTPYVGQMIFNGTKPTWWNGTAWVDATGTPV